MLNIAARDFISKSEVGVNKFIEENPEHNVCIVKFTSNFSLLIKHCLQFQGCLDKIESRGFIHKKVEVESLFAFINARLFSVENYAKESGIFVTLKGMEGFDFNYSIEKVDLPMVMYCSHSLAIVNSLMQRMHVVLTGSVNDIEEKEVFEEILIANQNLSLLVQTCLVNIESVQRSIYNLSLKDMPNSSVVDFNSILFNSVIQDFIGKLETKVNERIRENPECRHHIVRFTCNLSTLINQWVQFQNHFNETISGCDYERYTIQNLIEFISKSLLSAKEDATRSFLFVGLKNKEKVVVDYKKFDHVIDIPCEINLINISKLIKRIYCMVGPDVAGTGILRDNFFKSYKKIQLLIQNCLFSIKAVEAEPIDDVLKASRNFGVASLRPLKINDQLKEFVMKLESDIDKCVKQNLQHSHILVKFTYNLSMLIDMLHEFRSYLDKTLKNDPSNTLPEVMSAKDAYNSVISIRTVTSQLFLFVRLKGMEDVNFFPSGDCCGLGLPSCIRDLKKVDQVIKECIPIVIDTYPYKTDSVRENFLEMTSEIRVLMQNCRVYMRDSLNQQSSSLSDVVIAHPVCSNEPVKK